MLNRQPVAGEITDLQCLYAISATHLGYQVVIKTQKALQNIDMKKHLYLKKRRIFLMSLS